MKKDVQQIGVGIIEKIHGDPSSPEATFDIRFCPPKGARPAQGVFGNKNYRADTLYQDIACYMHFNRSFVSKKGKKIESENVSLPKSVMIAFNLVLNQNGTFSAKRDRNDSIYNQSPLEKARHVISDWYKHNRQ